MLTALLDDTFCYFNKTLTVALKFHETRNPFYLKCLFYKVINPFWPLSIPYKMSNPSCPKFVDMDGGAPSAQSLYGAK